MSEVLSQEEIDALLSNIAEGNVDSDNIENMGSQQRIKTYDFRRPNKFSKPQINFLRSIHESFCQSLKSYFTARLHSTIGTKIISIEQITYDEFIRSLPTPTVLTVFSLNPLDGMMLLEISPSLSFTIIDRLLGGEGREFAQNRDLTDIEKIVIEKRMEQVVGLFKEAWSEVYEITPQFVTLETNPQFTQIVAPNEMIGLVTIEVLIGDIRGFINICLPYMALEPIMDKMSSVFLFSGQSKHNTDENFKRMKNRIEKVSVDMIAVLGTTEILVKDLLELSIGDVIPLSQDIHEKLPVYIGDFIKFEGVPGLHKQNLGIQITEVKMEVGD